jgi:hypothetical protein
MDALSILVRHCVLRGARERELNNQRRHGAVHDFFWRRPNCGSQPNAPKIMEVSVTLPLSRRHTTNF